MPEVKDVEQGDMVESVLTGWTLLSKCFQHDRFCVTFLPQVDSLETRVTASSLKDQNSGRVGQGFFLIVFCNGFLLLEIIANNGLFQKKSKEWGLGHTFFEKTPGVSRFVNLPLVISNKTRSHSWKYRNILLHLTLRNFKAKNQNPRKFHMIFS